MRVRSLFPPTLTLAVLAVVPFLCPAAEETPAAPPVLPAATAGLSPDPAITRGQLPNGLRYALRPHALPPGRLSLFLYIDAGSRDESDTENGYAHFVEHLAFAGSRDFPGDGTIRALQRYGLGFGSEVNAATGRTYTVYEIRNLPAGDPAALATALKVLRNYADGLLFEPEAVERERGVILSEGNVRAGRVSYWWGRELEYLPPFLEEARDREVAAVFAGTPVARSQLGTDRSLRRANAERLRAFYDRWYRPEHMVLAVAGVIDPADLAARIRAEFGPLAGRGEAPAPKAPLVPKPPGRDRILAATDPQSPVQILTLAAAVPRSLPDTAERRRRELAERLAITMIERRLSRTSRVIAEVDGLVSHEIPGWSVPILRMRTAPADWADAAVALVTEARRAAKLGFAAVELAETAEARLNKARWAERDAANRPSAEVALALAHATGLGLVFPSAAEERRWLEETIRGITPEDCRAAAVRLLPEESTQLVLAGPVSRETPGMDTVRAAIKDARAGRFEAYQPEAGTVAAQLPESFGLPGHVVAEEANPVLDCRLVRFDNGVQLNFKQTAFEQGRVRVRVGFGHGLIGTEPGREGLVFSVAALCYGGIGGLTFEQEREIVNRAEVTTTFGFGADRFGLSANCPSGGLDTALRLFAARLAQPAFRLSGEAHARAFIDEQLSRYDRRSAGVAEDRLREYLFGGHHALTRPRRADTERLTFEDLRRWIEPQLRNSPLEITVVGDIGFEEVKAIVGRTLGALPQRSTVDPMADRRLFTPGTAPQRQEVRFKGRRSVATVALAWRLPDVVGQEDDCRMRLLASVLEDRIRVRLRREMGKTYTPVVGLMSERALAPAMLFLRCRIETAPRQLERVAEAAKAVVADLKGNGISEEELERARLPLVRQAEDNATSNVWWVTALSEAQSKPQFAEGQGEQKRILKAITHDELVELAHLLFAPDRLVEVRAVPE